MAAEPRTITELAPALCSREPTSEAITNRCLSAIAKRDPSLNAFITVLGDAGRYPGPLHGVPVSLKDLIDLSGTPASAASRGRQAHMPTADATITTGLREAGAQIVGHRHGTTALLDVARAAEPHLG